MAAANTFILTSNVLWGLLFSHFLADFTFQTNYIAQWKEKNIWGRWVHVVIFLITTYIITFPTLNEIWFNFGVVYFQGWFCVFVLTILHLLEDQFRIWAVREKKISDSIFFFLYDQGVHVTLIFLFTPRITTPCLLDALWLKWGTLFVINTHFTTILVYYLEKTVFGEATMAFREKHLSILERIGIMACFCIPGWWWLIGVSFWIFYRLYTQKNKTWINITLSYTIAPITGLLTRLIIFS